MVKPVEFLDAARGDFDESFDWYAKRSVAVAVRFAAAVDQAIEEIAAHPRRFPFVRDCQYSLLKRYPFRIVYRDQPDRIVIVAVAHAKRRPGFWRIRK